MSSFFVTLIGIFILCTLIIAICETIIFFSSIISEQLYGILCNIKITAEVIWYIDVILMLFSFIMWLILTNI